MKKTKKFNPSLKTISYSIAAIMAGTLASQNAQAVVNINSSTDYSDNLTVSKMKNIADQQAKDALATARLYDVIKEIAKDPSLSQSTKIILLIIYQVMMCYLMVQLSNYIQVKALKKPLLLIQNHWFVWVQAQPSH